MKIKRYCGNDPIVEYTIEEIEKMYLSEGLSPEEARARAKITWATIYELNKEERNMWDRKKCFEASQIPKEERLLYST